MNMPTNENRNYRIQTVLQMYLKENATIPEIVEETGYSKRMVNKILKDHCVNGDRTSGRRKGSGNS